MIKATIVVFLILLTTPLQASELNNALAGLENDWAATYYQADEAQQRLNYPQLLGKADQLVRSHPQSAEAKIWLATIMVSRAALESSLTVLSTLDAAKALLETAIKTNPTALNGAAYLTLGTLYYMVPGWPVSFGNNRLAEQMLKTSLQINPNGIDANYFYADFLLHQDRDDEAEPYLRKASTSAIRKPQSLSDLNLQKQAKTALSDLQQNKPVTDDKFHALFASAN